MSSPAEDSIRRRGWPFRNVSRRSSGRRVADRVGRVARATYFQNTLGTSGGADHNFTHRFAFISNRGKVPVGMVSTGTRKANASSNDFSSRFTKADESEQPGAGSIWTLNSVSERAVLTVTWYSATSPHERMMSSTALGKTFTPRTMIMSSVRPRMPPSNARVWRPHTQG